MEKKKKNKKKGNKGKTKKKNTKKERVQCDNTDPTPLRPQKLEMVTSAASEGCEKLTRTQLSSTPIKNEWKLPLPHEGGTATLKERFEIGEPVDDEKPVAMPQETTRDPLYHNHLSLDVQQACNTARETRPSSELGRSCRGR